MKFAIVNLGCKVNRVESDDVCAAFLAAGCVAADDGDADVVVVNTCTVTGEADKKTRKAIRHALKLHPHADVIVSGCAAAIDPAFFESLAPNVRVVPKASLLDEVRSLTAASSVEERTLRVGDTFPTRVGVKVQDGCDNACTYCIVHVARGAAYSRPKEEILAECSAYARAGAREIVLTGINLGSYDDGVGLAGLLRLLLETTRTDATVEMPCADSACPDVRFRISSVEPLDIDDDLIQVIASSDGRICRHLHLPLQAGSTRVLSEMARPYTAEAFKDLVERLYERIPELSLSTDIIVGFPGETEGDFQETLELARFCRFSRIHVFPYSRREGTPAAERADQVSPEVKDDRARRLRNLASELRAQDATRRSGNLEWALVESRGQATTESYHVVDAPAGSVEGQLVQIAMP